MKKIAKDTIKDIKKTLKRFEKILMEAFLSDEERKVILKMMEKHDNLVEDLKSGKCKSNYKNRTGGIKYE